MASEIQLARRKKSKSKRKRDELRERERIEPVEVELWIGLINFRIHHPKSDTKEVRKVRSREQ
ncbi:hypothetical protein SLEP1_g11413 [Rubroshorea leprosula]|uniref:Uncharacterized protein n=1 Tax=Rubroshorea leprosula TaxID=152421 RepID=A0AAV5IJ77_9ROSI|nr:hypothetical protein SLEP1_g11413 [Rubroshorea leprosula]